MVLDLKHRNKASQESLFGWFPGGQEPTRSDPKEIYIKLGSRPPRDQSYYETDILYQYHQSLNPSQRDYPSKQTASEALKPPWSLHMQLVPNAANNEEELEKLEKSRNRAKSAPSMSTKRIILKIPNATLNTLFDLGESIEGRQSSFLNEQAENETNEDPNNMRPKTSYNPSYTPTPSETPDGSRKNTESRNSTRIKSSKSRQSSDGSAKESDKNTNQLSNNTSEQQNFYTDDANYSTILNDLIDSKYLENITSKHDRAKQIESSTEPIAQISETVRKYSANSSASKSANYRSIPNIHKVIEVKNIGKRSIIVEPFENQQIIAHNKFRPTKNNLKCARPKTTANKPINANDQFGKLNDPKSRAGTAPVSSEDRRKSFLSNSALNKPAENHYTLSDYHKELLMMSLDKKAITGTTSQLALAEKLNRPASKNIETEVLQTNTNSFGDVKLVEGNWKDQLLNRGNYLQKRPKYNVKIDPDKIKADPPPIELHHNAAETYFYNTLPFRKATFTINPNFISENLNVKKLELQKQSKAHQANNNLFGPVKYRRDYAFVY